MENYNNIFEGMYILLCLDQLPNGYWGYSLPKDLQASFTTEKYLGSYTISGYAVISLYEFCNDPSHISIRRFLETIFQSYNPKSGAFGRRVRYTTNPDIKNPYIIIENNRHSALFLELLMRIHKTLDNTIIKGIKHLVKSQKNMGWRLNPSEINQDADCLTVAFVLKCLHKAKDMGIDKKITKKEYQKLENAINSGMEWLAENTLNGYWIFEDQIEKRILYTCHVLASIPQISVYNNDIYGEALSNLIYYCEKRKGLLYFPESDLVDYQSTAQLIKILFNEKDKYKSLLENTMKSFSKAIYNKDQISKSHSDDWAFTLSLISDDFLKIKLNTTTRKKLDFAIDEIENRFLNGEYSFNDSFLLDYNWIKSPILSILNNKKIIDKENPILSLIEEKGNKLLTLIDQKREKELEIIKSDINDMKMFTEKIRRTQGKEIASNAGKDQMETLKNKKLETINKWKKLELKAKECSDFKQFETLSKLIERS